MSSGRSYDVPRSWIWAPLGDIAFIVGGGTPRRDQPEYFKGGNILWATPTDINADRILTITETATRITRKGLTNSSARLLPPGTVLYSSRASIGKIAVAGKPVTTNQGFANLIPHKGILSYYLAYCLKRFTEDIKSLASGTTYLEVAKSELRKFQIPLPPTAEQKRIVQKIEELSQRLEVARKALKKIPIIVKQFRQSVLAKAFRGELTERNPRDEPASGLLQRISLEIERFSDRVAKPFQSDNSGLPRLPNNWIWTRLGDISFIITKGATPTSYGHEYVEKGIAFVKVENLSKGLIDKNSITQFITSDTHEFLKRSQLAENDVLFSIAGTIGKVAVARQGDLPANTNQAIAIIRCPWSFVNPYYLQKVLESSIPKLSLEEKPRGVAMNNISLKDVFNILLPLPPLSEQETIVSKVSQLFHTVNQVESQVETVYRRSEMLEQSIFAKAFRAELVPRDGSDESASVLLERIRAQREPTSKRGKSQTVLEIASPARITPKA